MSASEICHILKHENYEPRLISFQKRAFVIGISQVLPADFLSRLGGCERIAEVLKTFSLPPYVEDILELLSPLPPKWMLGVSSLSMSHNINLKRLAVDMKKAARAEGSKLKFITPSKSRSLSSAQIFNNELHLSPNAEVLLMDIGKEIAVARTIAVQDIAAYELRDTSRPARDAKIGMLPPKLAQVMLNTAFSHLPKTLEKPYTVLDPFCGTGVVLQEALLMGHDVVGSDVNPDMVAATKTNLEWLKQQFSISVSQHTDILHHDIQETYPAQFDTRIDAVVTEPYLGAPLSSPLPLQQLEKRVQELGSLYVSFFRNIRPLLRNQGVVLLLLPATRAHTKHGNQFQLFPDQYFSKFEKEGFQKISFIPTELEKHLSPTPRGTFVYGRPDAFVAREFTLWKKI